MPDDAILVMALSGKLQPLRPKSVFPTIRSDECLMEGMLDLKFFSTLGTFHAEEQRAFLVVKHEGIGALRLFSPDDQARQSAARL